MLFYKIEAIADENFIDASDSRTAREVRRNLSARCEKFNRRQEENTFCFLSGVDGNAVTAGAIFAHPIGVDAVISAFFGAIGLSARDRSVTEIVISEMEKLLSAANRQDFIDDDDEIKEKFGLDKITGRFGRPFPFGENLIVDRSRGKILQCAKKYLMNATFPPEIDRIYSAAAAPNFKGYGHPVHYLLETDDAETRREICRLLLSALYANHRLENRRYGFLDLKADTDLSKLSYDALYRASFGGAVIVRYLSEADAEESDTTLRDGENVEIICETAKRYRNRVLTVFCLPRACENLKRMFYENLGTVSLVELREEFADAAQTKAFLKMLAGEAGVRTDKKLFEKLEEDRGYLAPELHARFDEWYNDKLKNDVYPQYKGISAVKTEIALSSPRGSAYDRLREMVGLDGAKSVLEKALRSCKMQKLYADRGFPHDRFSMHMVFTGNPGTAKTTAARLFARILKDNGVLSRGQLVEVGRADLVGKYVGWTANLVQSRFKAALGGVLFIDEAYSLVEKDGLYGDEAINTIVQEMENHREEVVVIFAGYPEPMERFLNKNPGLRSRIAFHVPFDDYSTQELCEIARLMAEQKSLRLTDGAAEKLAQVFDVARKREDFGNGRYVRNTLEQAQMNQASRLLAVPVDKITDRELMTIRAEDIPLPPQTAPGTRRIGFNA